MDIDKEWPENIDDKGHSNYWQGAVLEIYFKRIPSYAPGDIHTIRDVYTFHHPWRDCTQILQMKIPLIVPFEQTQDSYCPELPVTHQVPPPPGAL